MANRFIHSLMKSHKGIFTSKNPLGFGLNNSFNYYSTNNNHDHDLDLDLVVGSNNNFEIVTNLDDALNLFDKMTQTRPLPSIDNFTKLLDFVTNMSHFSCSIHLFKQMCAIGVPFDNYTASIVTSCYCSLFDNTVESLMVLGSCFKRGIQLDVSTYNTVLNSFILEDRTHESETLFKKLIRYKFCEPDLLTYNTMINGLCKIGNNYAAIALLRLMDGRGCTPNHVTYNTVIHGLCNDLMTDDAFKLFKQMVSHKNIPPDVETYNSLIYAFSKLGRWDDATTMLKQMEDNYVSPNVITFNILVDAFCRQNNVKEAQVVCDLMVESAIYNPDIVTYNSLIHGYLLQDEIDEAEKVFDHMVFRGVKPNADTGNSFMQWQSRFDTLEDYYDMFNTRGMEPKYNIISKYIESNHSERMFRHMFPDGYEQTPLLYDPDIYEPVAQGKCQIESPYIGYLRRLCDRYELASALDLFHYMDDIGSELNSDIDVYNMLIYGAKKCWKFDTARRLFHDLAVKGIQPDFRTYRLMVKGFCARGLLRDAKQLFLKLDKSDRPPESILQKFFNPIFGDYNEDEDD